MENDVLVFPDLFDRQRDFFSLVPYYSMWAVSFFFFFCMLVFIALVDLRHRMDTIALSANISVYHSHSFKQQMC